ncbi:hypothetical protein U9M48_040411 [Paspalum notatum var. saurae]|uniref:Ubiquitin-like protease family profile domain-containing protein n=1 Tax=Paspalum notatum var. saurae TaxID=547442 RepID=A0AAQ3ULQ7_PASNO
MCKHNVSFYFIYRCMVQKINKQQIPVGILDHEMMSIVVMRTEKQASVDYLVKALYRYATRKEYITFFHQTGNHWVLVVIIPKWNKVLYLDSLRSQLHDNNLILQCHQQPPGNSCGFYAIHHLRIVMKKTNLEKSEDLDLPTNHVDQSVLSSIRTELAAFLLTQVIDEKGEFYYPRRGC